MLQDLGSTFLTRRQGKRVISREAMCIPIEVRSFELGIGLNHGVSRGYREWRFRGYCPCLILPLEFSKTGKGTSSSTTIPTRLIISDI
jgi:hypothetical protein